MRIGDIIAQGTAIARLDAVMIISMVTATTKETVLADHDKVVDESTAGMIIKLFEERSKGRPLAYIMKRKEFFSEELYVDERVLIPRPETEILVETALDAIAEGKGTPRALDMGTGSGAIGLILAKKAAINVLCTDISIEALGVAGYNARRMGVSEKITLLCSDLFGAMKEAAVFDIITANLPYVPIEEWADLMKDVRDYEPPTALAGGRDGVEIYKRFIERLPHHFARGGSVFCEVAGRAQAELVGAMLNDKGLDVVLKKDLSGNERVLIGRWTNLS